MMKILSTTLTLSRFLTSLLGAASLSFFVVQSGFAFAAPPKKTVKKQTTRKATTRTAQRPKTNTAPSTILASSPRQGEAPATPLGKDVDYSNRRGGKLPQGSFIVAPVHSVSELVQQVKDSPTLMSRYVQVYRRTPEEITEYLSTLKLVPLSDDFRANVYYVYPDGTAAYRTRRVKRGTMVFVDPQASNRPILVQACGNPLTQVAPVPDLMGPPQISSGIDFSEDEVLPKRTAVLPVMAMVDMAPSKLAVPTATRLVNTLPVVPPVLGVTRLTPVPPLTPPIPPVRPPFFPPIIPPIFPRDDNPTPPEIPEPGTVALALSSLGSGVLMRVNARRRRNR